MNSQKDLRWSPIARWLLFSLLAVSSVAFSPASPMGDSFRRDPRIELVTSRNQIQPKQYHFFGTSSLCYPYQETCCVEGLIQFHERTTALALVRNKAHPIPERSQRFLFLARRSPENSDPHSIWFFSAGMTGSQSTFPACQLHVLTCYSSIYENI